MKIKNLKLSRIGTSRGFIIPSKINIETLDEAPELDHYYDLEITKHTEEKE